MVSALKCKKISWAYILYIDYFFIKFYKFQRLFCTESLVLNVDFKNFYTQIQIRLGMVYSIDTHLILKIPYHNNEFLTLSRQNMILIYILQLG